MSFIRTGKIHGHCLSCDYKGLFKAFGICPNCGSNNVKARPEKIKLKTNQVSKMARKINSLKTRIKVLSEFKNKVKLQERVHHEAFSLFKTLLGKEKYDEIISTAYKNCSIPLGSISFHKKKVVL